MVMLNNSGSRIRIRMFLPCPDPGKKVWKWMNKSLFCRVGHEQCKQFHFFCSDFKPPLLRIIWNVKKTNKKIIFSLYPHPPPPDTPRIRIRMKIFARIRMRKKKCGSETLVSIYKREIFFCPSPFVIESYEIIFLMEICICYIYWYATGCSLNIVVFFQKILEHSGLWSFSWCHTHQAGRTPALQQNWQRKITKI